MKLTKTLLSLLAAVLAALLLAACGGQSSPPPTSAPAPSPTVSTIPVHPQRGGIEEIVKGASGRLKCSDKVTSTELVLGGTVSQNDVDITANKSDSGVVLHFESSNTIAKSLVINGKIQARIPATGMGPSKNDLELSAKDFGDITSLVLCGGLPLTPPAK